MLLRIPARWNDFIAGTVLLGVLVFDGRLRCALQRNLRRQKYARFISPPTPLQAEAKRTHNRIKQRGGMMNPWRRYSWEIALAALLIFEILAFGVINPRLLDINVLLF